MLGLPKMLAYMFTVVASSAVRLSRSHSMRMSTSVAVNVNKLPKSLLPLRMRGAILPGDRTVAFTEINIPKLEEGQVLLQVKASTICGSDIRCIYNEHLGVGAEGYQAGMIAGHEPAGVVVEVGANMKQTKVGQRALVYHVSGCGMCTHCRRGFANACSNPRRAAYGWQRNGGMAQYLLAEEKDLVNLPDSLSFVDGAIVACSGATVYQGLVRLAVSGKDQLLVVGLGPVGLSALMLAKALGVSTIVGVDNSPSRCALAQKFADHVIVGTPSLPEENLAHLRTFTDGGFGFEKVLDCSGSAKGREMGLKLTKSYGSMCLIGEGGSMTFDASNDLIHGQKTLLGSWVSQTWLVEELVINMARWDLHLSDLVTHRYTLDQVGEAYKTMNDGQCGKVAVLFD